MGATTESAPAAAYVAAAPTAAIEEELPRAIKIHDASVHYARRFMSDTRMGKLDLTSASPIIENILESLSRNADALISLSRLHRSDTYTYTHCVNVSILVTYYSRYLGKPEPAVFDAGLAGLFHDVGKAMIPTHVLNAPRKLTKTEFAIMRRHPLLGYEQLAAAPGITPAVLMGALEHHEKFDGTGYPKRLSGNQISLIGRMIGIADVYDALTSRRVYKEPMFPHKALGILYQLRNKEFDASFVAEFIRMVGIYPVGSVVVLEGGWRAVVSRSNLEKPTQPVIILVLDPEGRPAPRREYDLAQGQAPSILHGIPAESAGIDPLRVLGLSS